MMNYINFINDFKFENKSILVRFYDNGRLGQRHEIYQWLKTHGFGCKKGFWDCPWVDVDLTNKSYYPGRPGFQYMQPAADHSINDDEFYTLMNILDHYEEVTYLEYEIICHIFNRRYKTLFIPVKPTNYEMEQVIIPKLDALKSGNLVKAWSCYNPNIKKCYLLLKENPNITLSEYKEKSGYNNKRNGSAGIYTIEVNN